MIRRQSTVGNREKGAITVAETLIVLAIAATVLVTWAALKNTELTEETARITGRMIGVYSRAAAEWLNEAPPATAGDYGIGELQDCADPAGPRFLSCSFPPATRLPFAFSTAGDPLSLNDLVIRVTLGAGGARGEIDFGVIRSGADDNGDGVPDSRPDLAAIAHRVASEQTGAGVNDFFELIFARADPSGLVFDSADPAFDQTAVDDLARLEARVGASVDAPFLRTDGSNEMQAGISFDNGVTITPGADNLTVTGGTGLVVNTAISAPAVTATATLTVDPLNGVRGAGFDRLDQSQEVADNRADIDANRSDIDANRASIATNESNIRANAAAIAALEPQNPAACTPTEASVRAANSAARFYAPSQCAPQCGRWRYTTRSHTYRVRNLATLRCETRTLKSYWNACFQNTGNCDGYCSNLGRDECSR